MKFLILTAALVLSTSSFAQLVKSSENLFDKAVLDNKGKTAGQVQAENLLNYEKFIAMDVNSRLLAGRSFVVDADKPKTITMEQAAQVIAAADENPVVSLHNGAYQKYDPSGSFGFCFGRATFVNLYLAQAGLNRSSIKKAFIVGPMMERKWGWHVTAIVQSTNKAGKEIWLAVDPAVGYTMEVKQWYKHWARYSDDKKLRLYISNVGKLGAGPSSYDEDAFRPQWYNKYFSDMMAWFAKNDVKTSMHL